MKKILLLAAPVVLSGIIAMSNTPPKPRVIKGEEVRVHGGKAWTWINLDNNGKPSSIGISLSDEALASMPTGGQNAGHGHGHSSENNWFVRFNAPGNIDIPFNHVYLNWNPNGHEPETIYDKPHFDFHFFSMQPEEVDAIPDFEKDSLKFKNIPTAEYFPSNYIYPGGGVAKMGAHWVDVTSDEFTGKPFTQTFILGSYEGKVTFYEPMITHEFLKNTTHFERAIPTPPKFQKSGWYPTQMKITKHDGHTDIVLTKFVYRTGS